MPNPWNVRCWIFLVYHWTMYIQLKFLSRLIVEGLNKEDWIIKFKGTTDYFANSCYNLITWSVVTVVYKGSPAGCEISNLLTIYQLSSWFRIKQLNYELLKLISLGYNT